MPSGSRNPSCHSFVVHVAALPLSAHTQPRRGQVQRHVVVERVPSLGAFLEMSPHRLPWPLPASHDHACEECKGGWEIFCKDSIHSCCYGSEVLQDHMSRGWQLPLGNFGNVVSGWWGTITMEDIFSFSECLVKWRWGAASSNGAEGTHVTWAISREELPGGGVTEAWQQLCADGASATSQCPRRPSPRPPLRAMPTCSGGHVLSLVPMYHPLPTWSQLTGLKAGT